MRRLDPFPPEVRALVADRLQYLFGPAAARRASDPPEVGRDTGSGRDLDRLDVDLPTDLPTAHTFGRAHTVVVAVLVLVGLLGAGWALFRARPVAVATTGTGASLSTPVPSAGATAGAGPTPAPTRTAARAIVVHVVGAVHRPGLVRLSEGARVQDAVDAAGGLTAAARPGRLNLAQLLGDGQQVLIGTARDPVSEVRDGTAPPGSSAEPGSAATVDLNRATATELEALPGVGPVTAAAIMAWRTEHGRFTTIEDLQQVDGIGPKTYAQIAPHVRV